MRELLKNIPQRTEKSRENGLREELITKIKKSSIDLKNIIWESPKKEQQTWFINTFGCNFNLGNINDNHVISLECLRIGLRGNTFNNYL